MRKNMYRRNQKTWTGSKLKIIQLALLQTVDKRQMIGTESWGSSTRFVMLEVEGNGCFGQL